MSWDDLKSNSTKKQIVEQVEDVNIDFKSLQEIEKKRGYKIGIYGDFATGKTHFALTAPEPIFIIDTEMGAAPLSFNFLNKDIKVLDVAEKDGVESYKKVVKAIEFISEQEKIGSVVIDSVSDVWEFCQEYAKVKIFNLKPLDRLKQQWDWGVINKLYLKIILKLLKLDCNLILTARENEIYASPGQPTNMVKPKWQKNTGFWVDFVLHMGKSLNKNNDVNFYMDIEKSRPIRNMMGKRYENIDFNKLIEEIEKNKNDIKN